MLAQLVANFAVIGLFAAAWINFQDWAIARPERRSALAFGALMGVAAVISVLVAVPVDGYLIDLRAVPVAVAAVAGGPLTGLVATVIAIAGRLIAGGAGAVLGSVSIALVFLCGLAGFALLRLGRGRILALSTTALLSGLRSLVLLPFFSAEARDAATASLQITMPVNILAILAVGYAILRGRDRAMHRALLVGAIEQAPDYFYVKDRHSRIVAANRNVARVHGRQNGIELDGLTDLDLESPERAAQLLAEEHEVLVSGISMIDRAEDVAGSQGEVRSFISSKSPIHTRGGNLVGLVGVTKDVTTLKQMQDELVDSRDRLAFVLQEMSDGVALLDMRGNILLTNERYRELFPRTGHLRVAGAFLPAILQAVLETDEQPAATSGDHRAWMAAVMTTARDGGDELVQLFDGRWLRLRTRIHANGVAIMVASDITSIKRAETDLLLMTKQLELLSITDGLTQLINRRGFDDALKKELARARRSDKPLSLVLLDIDRFKAFNDRYGHLEGDECLRKVAVAVTKAVNRPGDLVARYGGEELVVILPDTTNQGAYMVAESIRHEIRAIAIPHEGSEMEIVTASLGFVTVDPQDPAITEAVLLKRADEALYQAKADGRDRSLAWFDPEIDLPIVAYLPGAGKASA